MTASPQILRSVWSNVRATCQRLGIDLTDLARDLDELDELRRGADALPAFDPIDVGAALVDCARTGANPLEDPRLMRAAVARVLADYAAGSVSAWSDHRRVELLTAAAPDLLDALRERVAAAQEAITHARAKGVPSEALASREYALPAALETPAAIAREAVADAEAAVSAWRSLVDAVTPTSVPGHHAVVIAADLPAEWHASLAPAQRSSVVSVVIAGHDLDMPADVDAYAARLARLEDERAALAARREREAADTANPWRHASMSA
jgi:hypothetical protein